jgi:hypothetical protein
LPVAGLPVAGCRFASYRVPVAGYRLPVCQSPVAGCRFPDTGCLPGPNCQLPIAHCLPLSAFSLLLSAFCLPPSPNPPEFHLYHRKIATSWDNFFFPGGKTQNPSEIRELLQVDRSLLFRGSLLLLFNGNFFMEKDFFPFA